MSTTLLPGERTYNPFNVETKIAFPEALEGRVIVKPEVPAETKQWVKTVDLNTGLAIEVRQESCGARCFCAGGVRLV